MSKKGILTWVIVSLVAMALLLKWVYDFQFVWLYVSNVMFVVGIALFFPGLIVFSGAGGALSSAVFLTKKVFANPKKEVKHLDSYNDFLVHRQAETSGYNLKSKGKVIMIIGSIYIVASVVIGYMI